MHLSLSDGCIYFAGCIAKLPIKLYNVIKNEGRDWMKKILCIVLAAAMLLPLVSCGGMNDELFVPDLSGTAASATVTVDPSEEHQLIRGFGGINYPTWIADLTEEQRETAFKNGEDQLGFSILRIHVDPDRENWSKELETAKAAVDEGLLVFASPWNPPAELCEKFNHNGNENAQRLRHDKYAEYAEHLNDFVTYMRDNGVELYAISIQNEPDYADGWTWWSTEEIMDFIINYSDMIDCRIMTPESFQYRKDFYDEILNSEEALSKVDIFATHFYGTQKWDMAYPLFEEKGEGKELWMTEVYVPDSSTDADVWPNALEVAANISDAMTEGNMQAYVWWYIRRFYGPMKEDGTISKRGYCMAQFSKFVRPGYIRIGATETPADGVSVSAYKGDGKTVIVAVNESQTSYGQRFEIGGSDELKYIEAYTTSANKSLERIGNVQYDSNEFEYVLEPESVTAFVITH